MQCAKKLGDSLIKDEVFEEIPISDSLIKVFAFLFTFMMGSGSVPFICAMDTLKCLFEQHLHRWMLASYAHP